VTNPPALTDVVHLEVTGMAHGGEAVGRTEEGMVVFADGALPGERAVVALERTEGRFARGVMVQAPAAPAPERTTPKCPYFGDWPARGLLAHQWCGACQWQHIAYAGQLEYKATTLVDTLNRIARLADPPTLPPIGMPEPWSYRNHIRLVADGNRLGYRAAGGPAIVPVAECPIAHPLVADMLGLSWEGLDPGTEVALRCGAATGDRMIVIHGGPDDLDEIEIETDASVALLDVDGTVHHVSGRPHLLEHLSGRDFLIPPDGFFQVNTVMAEHLVQAVLAGLSGSDSGRLGRLVDLHSGVGTFAILAAHVADEVFAVERHPPSVAAAVENAEGMDNLTLLESSAHEGLAYLGAPLDAVILDPPRAGMDRATMRVLAEIAPRTIVYVSCEPSTLARDVAYLVEKGWALESCRVIDMFPQTFHIESVSVLRRTA
jgi:23S rRNA (uracil1939-C5)-methyltransferase